MGLKPLPVKHDSRILGMVLTPAEVVRLWGVQRKTVEMAILTDRLVARRTVTDSAYLVLTSSVIALWGEPVNSRDWQALLKEITPDDSGK